jgi:arsenate reductase
VDRPPNQKESMLKVYTYAKCSTCRRATDWLRARGAAFAEHPIRETPPTLAELRRLLAAYGGQIKRLFNTSGLDYRALKLGDTLAGLGEAEALALLAGNGNLVKRPVLLGPGVARVGFNPEAWTAALDAAS